MDDRFIGTPDLGYPISRTGVEYDGRHHAENERQWGHDIGRRETFDDVGWRLIIVRNRDLAAKSALLQRVQRILRERGEPGVPNQLSDDWRDYF